MTSDISEAQSLVASISDDLTCLESCETQSDMIANVDEALASAKRLVAELEDLKGQVSP